jgi:hypothetical protein
LVAAVTAPAALGSSAAALVAAADHHRLRRRRRRRIALTSHATLLIAGCNPCTCLGFYRSEACWPRAREVAVTVVAGTR